MNPEQPQPPEQALEQPDEPRHRGELVPETGDREGDAYVAYIVTKAPTPQTAATIGELYRRYGTAFAHYLSLDGTDRYVRDFGPGDPPADPAGLEADFRNVYYGTFVSREALIDDTIASFDWGTDLARLLRGHPDLQQMVAFDRDAIWGFVGDHYEIVHGSDGRLHVFER